MLLMGIVFNVTALNLLFSEDAVSFSISASNKISHKLFTEKHELDTVYLWNNNNYFLEHNRNNFAILL